MSVRSAKQYSARILSEFLSGWANTDVATIAMANLHVVGVLALQRKICRNSVCQYDLKTIFIMFFECKN